MKIHNFTVCDLARPEENGKFLLVGVYSNAIVFPRIPAQFNLTMWMLLEHEATGDVTFAIRGRMPESDQDLFEISADATVTDIRPWNPLVLSASILIGQSGPMVIEAKIDSGEWFELRRLFIQRQVPVKNTRD